MDDVGVGVGVLDDVESVDEEASVDEVGVVEVVVVGGSEEVGLEVVCAWEEVVVCSLVVVVVVCC